MRILPTVALASLAVSACATTTDGGNTAVYDPLEGWNRGVYAFNETVDKAAIEPTARAYRAVTPEIVRDGVSNFLSNLGEPVVFANAVLQGKPETALDTVGRFLLNTTVGIGGVFDPASAAGVPKHNEDFGQTLGVWGVGEGPYLMLPLLGPSNARDLVGKVGDRGLDPLSWTEFASDPDLDDEIALGRTVMGAISARERLIESIELLRSQPEPYVALRRNYTTQRRAAVRDGSSSDDPYQNLPDLDAYDGYGDAFEDGGQEED